MSAHERMKIAAAVQEATSKPGMADLAKALIQAIDLYLPNRLSREAFEAFEAARLDLHCALHYHLIGTDLTPSTAIRALAGETSPFIKLAQRGRGDAAVREVSLREIAEGGGPGRAPEEDDA